MTSQCYGYRSNSTDHNPASYAFILADAVPCPSSGGCCRPGDACLSNSICQYISWKPPGVSSGYYMGSCTDPTFNSPSCPKACTALTQPGVIYDTSTKQWRCCGANADGSFACDHPSSITFQGPPPDQLRNLSAPLVSGGGAPAATPVSTRIVLSSTSAVTGGSPSTAAAPIETSPASENSLSTGAKAGIGAGAGAAVLIIAALMIWFFMSRRKCEAPPELAQHGELLPKSRSGVLRKNNSKEQVPEIVGLTEYPKHEHRREDMLPAYSSGELAHPNAAELEAMSRSRR